MDSTRWFQKLGESAPVAEHAEAAKIAGVHAYVTGPSGGGKSTFAKMTFPSSEFKIIHTDDYEVRGPRGGYDVDWGKIKKAIKGSSKPVVIEGMVMHKSLARSATRKIIVDPGRNVSLKQRLGRGRKAQGKDDKSAREGKRLWGIYRKTILPEARSLGFQRVKPEQMIYDKATKGFAHLSPSSQARLLEAYKIKKASAKVPAMPNTPTGQGGHWRRLSSPRHKGKDQFGNPVAGKTWVRSGLKGFVKLKPHQADFAKAVVKLKPKGGIIAAHGTGTGKTVSSIAAFEKRVKAGKSRRALVITPAGLRANYLNKGVKKFTHSKGVIVQRPPTSVDPGTSYVITSYAAFRRNPQAFLDAVKPDTIIADEVHRAANPEGATHKALMYARGKVTTFMGLTASIVQNQPSEVVPMVQLATGGTTQFKTKKQFSARYVKRTKTPQRKITGGPVYQKKIVRKQELVKKIGPAIHYIEDLDAKEKPPKSVQTVSVPMSDHQLKIYRMSMKGIDPKIKAKIQAGQGFSQKEAMGVFTRLLRARQVSNSLSSVTKMSPEVAAQRTPKLTKMLGDLEGHLKSTPDGKAIIYTNFVHGGVDVIKSGLDSRGIKYGVFAGKSMKGMTEQSRQQAVKDYQAGKIKVIVITGAGAEGLSLGNTTLVQLYDGHYNPERIAQAEARGVRAGGQAHRPLEKRKVLVKRYVSTIPQGFFSRLFLQKQEKGVEEAVYATAARKAQATGELRKVLQARSTHEKKKRESVLYNLFGTPKVPTQ